MAATFSSLSCASPSIVLKKARTVQLLRSQDPLVSAPLLPPSRSRIARRHQRVACIKATKTEQDGHRESSRRRAGLTGLLLPSVAAMLIGSTPFAPEARAEMSQTDYYQSLMESMKKAAQAPPVAAPTQAPPVVAAVAPVAEAPAPSEDISSFKSYFSSLTETKPKEEAPKAPEQPKALTAAELRAKRVAEVAQREREEAERKAAEQKAAQEAKAQAEARAAKEAADRAEKEAQQKAKEASEKVKSEREAQEKSAREVAAAAKSKKTHGYLPLFVAQFLFLALYAGGITLAFFLPDSLAKKLEAKTNELGDRVGPLLEKAQPYVEKAVAAGNGLFKQAKPYVSKAAQEAVPLVNKAVQASKPLVSQAQAKAGEAINKIKAEQESL